MHVCVHVYMYTCIYIYLILGAPAARFWPTKRSSWRRPRESPSRFLAFAAEQPPAIHPEKEEINMSEKWPVRVSNFSCVGSFSSNLSNNGRSSLSMDIYRYTHTYIYVYSLSVFWRLQPSSLQPYVLKKHEVCVSRVDYYLIYRVSPWIFIFTYIYRLGIFWRLRPSSLQPYVLKKHELSKFVGAVRLRNCSLRFLSLGNPGRNS